MLDIFTTGCLLTFSILIFIKKYQGTAYTVQQWYLSVCLSVYISPFLSIWLPRWLSGKESSCQRSICKFDPWVGKIPWSRKWQPIPVFLSGKSHGQRSMTGYSPWGYKELDTTERLGTHTERHTHIYLPTYLPTTESIFNKLPLD